MNASLLKILPIELLFIFPFACTTTPPASNSKNTLNPYEALLTEQRSVTPPINQDTAPVDMNTTEYRYIGYFTQMRKAIEKVWDYPKDAAKERLQGSVLLEWIIEKDGKVTNIRLNRSSGHKILDSNILETLTKVSPLAPLPEVWGRERLPVKGEFKYILTKFGDKKTSGTQPSQK